MNGPLLVLYLLLLAGGKVRSCTANQDSYQIVIDSSNKKYKLYTHRITLYPNPNRNCSELLSIHNLTLSL